MHLEKRIKVEHANGTQFPLHDFNIIFIVYGIKQGKEILTYISKNIHAHTQVIYRTTYYPEDISTKNQVDVTSLFEVKEKIRSKTLGQVDSFLLHKKTSK